MIFHPERVAENGVAPLQGAGERSLRSGGLRYAPTTGYYLAAFQAENVLATLAYTLVSGWVEWADGNAASISAELARYIIGKQP